MATRFWSPNNYYLQLSTPTQRPTVGEYMIFNVKTNTFINKVYYHVSWLSAVNLDLSLLSPHPTPPIVTDHLLW